MGNGKSSTRIKVWILLYILIINPETPNALPTLSLTLHPLIYSVSVASILEMYFKIVNPSPRSGLIIFTRTVIAAYPWHRNIAWFWARSAYPFKRIEGISRAQF